MAQLIVRNLEECVKARLRRQAIGHGRSLEEEVREILRHAVGAVERPDGLGTRIHNRFAKIGLDRKLWELRGHTVKPVVFR